MKVGKRNCEWCGRKMVRRYPGSVAGRDGEFDSYALAENGPARLSCGCPPCDRLREDIARHKFHMTATAEQVYDEALTDNKYEDEARAMDLGDCTECGGTGRSERVKEEDFDPSGWPEEEDDDGSSHFSGVVPMGQEHSAIEHIAKLQLAADLKKKSEKAADRAEAELEKKSR